MIQIITTLDEILSHISNISWLYHFNSIWKVPLMWFHKKHLDEVFDSNKHNYVGKKKVCWKIMLQPFVPKSILHVYKKKLDEIKEKWPQIIQNVFFLKYIFLPKVTPTPPLLYFHPSSHWLPTNFINSPW
jgi:hypothetical protein